MKARMKIRVKLIDWDNYDTIDTFDVHINAPVPTHMEKIPRAFFASEIRRLIWAQFRTTPVEEWVISDHKTSPSQMMRDMEEEAKQEAGATTTGRSEYYNVAVQYYPVSKRFNWFLKNGICSKKDVLLYLERQRKRQQEKAPAPPPPSPPHD